MFREAATLEFVGRRGRLSAGALLLSLLVGCGGGARQDSSTQASLTADSHAGAPPAEGTVTPFATGLNNPRGLKFGPDGAL
ncbi:MAG TPA: hypothetical protein VLQ79_04745, partial [Myxococcaceae bacterium]|nr:hypothetical protein [Myxococcaceae bacterium]